MLFGLLLLKSEIIYHTLHPVSFSSVALRAAASSENMFMAF